MLFYTNIDSWMCIEQSHSIFNTANFFSKQFPEKFDSFVKEPYLEQNCFLISGNKIRQEHFYTNFIKIFLILYLKKKSIFYF